MLPAHHEPKPGWMKPNVPSPTEGLLGLTWLRWGIYSSRMIYLEVRLRLKKKEEELGGRNIKMEVLQKRDI